MPTPKTVCVLVWLNSAQRVHWATRWESTPSFSSRSSRGIEDRARSKSDVELKQGVTEGVGALSAGCSTFEAGSERFRDRDETRETPAARKLESCCAAALRAEIDRSPDIDDILPKSYGANQGDRGSSEVKGFDPPVVVRAAHQRRH